MCGIIAYVGGKQARDLLIEGLKRLEYRGYDSAGIAILNTDGMWLAKTAGRVRVLEEEVCTQDRFNGKIGIAHTRWATHGEPSECNAHPHVGGHGIVLVHNGIIENFATLKTYLIEQGHQFQSETDTEVLAHLIGHFYENDLESAVRQALNEVTGAYAIAVMSEQEPDVLVVARKGSPLMIGVGNGEYIVASDASAIVAHTKQAIELDDDTIARLTTETFRTSDLQNVTITPQMRELEVDLEQIELGEYPHYMIKEIHEQPEAIRRCLQGRLAAGDGRVVLGGLAEYARELGRTRRIVFLGQGTALHAGMIGSHLVETLAKIPSRSDFSSEFRYRNPIIEEGTVVVAISQSGETADTQAALREASRKGARTLGLVNVVGSTITRESDAGVYLRVGPEIGVASTKAFIGQVAASIMLAVWLGRRRYLSPVEASYILDELNSIPGHITRVLEQSVPISEVVSKYVQRDNWLFLGRGVNYPVALEGALKLKEISYIHAEGMPAAEMKHGPIALIDQGMPVVVVATRSSQYEKVLSNIQEVRSRGGHVIAVATEGDTSIESICEDVFYVPDIPEPLQPLLTVIPLQLLAYHAAVLRGHDVDKPRNLAKSVTVE